MNFNFTKGGYQDKEDSASGLQWEHKGKRIVERKNLVFCDSRDCIGTQSLRDSQLSYESRGGRGEISGSIRGAAGTPIVVTVSGTLTENQPDSLRNGDKLFISKIFGNTAANGQWIIQNINYGAGTFELDGTVSNGTYTGGGFYIKPADPGFPQVRDTDSKIVGNEMIVNLNKKIKVIKSLSLIHTIVPRDIIPLQVYIPDLNQKSIFVDLSSVNNRDLLAASTGNVNVAGTISSLDGVTIPVSGTFLLKDQTDPIENGTYIRLFGNDRISPIETGDSYLEVNNKIINVLFGNTNAGQKFISNMPTGIVGTNPIYFNLFSNNDSYIPQEAFGLSQYSIGFYSTPLAIWRTYCEGAFSLPNVYTPPPLQLWNPDLDPANHQAAPYVYQTVPTYKSNDFNVIGESGVFHLMLSGHGVYDLNDWTYLLNTSSRNIVVTKVMRYLLLFAICQFQTLNGVDYVELIINSEVTSNTTESDFYGYGDYQRFIPGPGLGMAYQPGTSDGADPTVADTDWPTPFPFFRGNVWGPYNAPGDRFQKLGLKDVVQDLYLNGDLANLFGTPIIKAELLPYNIPSDDTFGINFQALITVTFGNIDDSTNPNILNAMRIKPNGYGALSVRALGDGNVVSSVFLNSGGQGPDIYGVPTDGYVAGSSDVPQTGGAWVETEVISGGSGGEFTDELGAGPSFAPDGSVTQMVATTDASNPGDGSGTPDINRRVSYYDFGPNQGTFIGECSKYRSWVTKELPDTNLVMKIFQSLRDNKVQSTNDLSTDAIFTCPIRLNLGTTSGTFEYVENVESFLAYSQEFWTKRYYNPLQSLHDMKIRFYTYEGVEIPLEKMLQQRRNVAFLQQFQTIFNGIDENLNDLFLKFIFDKDKFLENLPNVFDPVNPKLLGREKRNISLVFNIQTYEYESPGLYMSRVIDMLEAETESDDYTKKSENLRASNYENYLNI